MQTPTEETYSEWQQAYDFFNIHLFAAQLPPCLITMQRHHRSYGYFCGNRWANQTGTIRDEIALNPAHFVTRNVAEVLSTLVHEMVHLWQHHYGKPSRSGYHNSEWATKMETVGLMPTHSGRPGGQRTGQHMTHYIQDNGRFAQVCQQLLTCGFLLSWHDRTQEETRVSGGGDDPNRPRAKTTGRRTKYTCPSCGLNAWAKPRIVLLCGTCQAVLVAPEEAMDAAA